MSSPIAKNENISKRTSIYNVTHQKHSIFMLVNVHILLIFYLSNTAFNLPRACHEGIFMWGFMNLYDPFEDIL